MAIRFEEFADELEAKTAVSLRTSRPNLIV
jgi:hypothetical protein